MKILLALSCVFLTACMSTLSVTYRSDPPGATIYQGSTPGGYAPITASYTPTEDFKNGGCMKLSPVKAVWISGATAATGEINACQKQGYDQVVSFMRPNVPGREMDVQWAMKRQENDANSDAAFDAMLSGIGQAIGSMGRRGASTPPAQVPSPTFSPSTPSTAYGGGCNSDLQCGYGLVCVRPHGQVNSAGTCVRQVDSIGLPIIQTRTPSVNVTNVPSCQFDSQCQLGYQCVKQGTELVGICVK